MCGVVSNRSLFTSRIFFSLCLCSGKVTGWKIFSSLLDIMNRNKWKKNPPSCSVGQVKAGRRSKQQLKKGINSDWIHSFIPFAGGSSTWLSSMTAMQLCANNESTPDLKLTFIISERIFTSYRVGNTQTSKTKSLYIFLSLSLYYQQHYASLPRKWGRVPGN